MKDTWPVKFATIVDHFTHSCFLPECELHSLKPHDSCGGFFASRPDLFFVESAWFGVDGLWHRKINKPSSELFTLIEHCRQRRIPSVFWCKEDPVHFHRFLQTASHFDIVLTSDVECIPLYKQLLGHKRVFLLPFANQPKAHNPLESFVRKDSASFAGSYYVRYPERIRDLENVISAVSTVCPVEIFDRYHNTTDINYQFPEQYQSKILGSLPPDQIDIAYKGYRYGINLNTVKNSGSMFARRVFELLGSGTVTISNDSPGMRDLFGDIVIASDDPDVIKQRMFELEADPMLRGKVSLAGVRKVMQDHTYGQRLARILKIALDKDHDQELPSVLIFSVCADQAELERIQQLLLSQRDVVWNAVLIVQDGAEPQLRISDDQRLRVVSDREFSSLSMMDLLGDAEWVACFSAKDYYGTNYLLDLLLSTRYSESGVFGKAEYFRAGESGVVWENQGAAYRPMKGVKPNRSLVKSDRLTNWSVEDFLALISEDGAYPESITHDAMSLDAFSYCQDAFSGLVAINEVSKTVDDLELKVGERIDDLYARADAMRMRMPPWLGKPALPLHRLAEVFGTGAINLIHGRLDKFGWHLVSELQDGCTGDLWAIDPISISEICNEPDKKIYVEAFPGLPLKLLIRFLKRDGSVIGQKEFNTNHNEQLEIPFKTVKILLGWRVYSSGTVRITRFVLDWLPTNLKQERQ